MQYERTINELTRMIKEAYDLVSSLTKSKGCPSIGTAFIITPPLHLWELPFILVGWWAIGAWLIVRL